MIEGPRPPRVRHGRIASPKPPKIPDYQWGLSKDVRGPRRGTAEGRQWMSLLLPGTAARVYALSPLLQGYAGRAIEAVGYGHNAATLPELIVYGWLLVHHYRPDVDFSFQSSSQGGRLERGGMVVDFLMIDRFPNIAIRIQGSHWHTGAEIVAKDHAQALVLAAYGDVVEDLVEEEIYVESILERNMARILGISI